jgi:N-methylhydantoinase B
MGRIPDVEMTEFLYPLLTLWRREEPDSGGPGRHRGGVSASLAVTPHGTQVPMGLILAAAGKAVAQNAGLSGGYPGNTGRDVVVRNSAARDLLSSGRLPASLEELEGEQELGQCYAQSYLAPGDVFFMHWQGGGGYGDPLLRVPDAVAHDVREGKITVGASERIYGVALTPDDAVDADRTTVLRRELRSSRRNRAIPDGEAVAASLDLTASRRLDDNLVEVVTDGKHVIGCAHCGQHLGDSRADAVLNLARYSGPAAEAGPGVTSDPATYVDAEIVFRQYCCPGCSTALYSALVPAGHHDHLHPLGALVPAATG